MLPLLGATIPNAAVFVVASAVMLTGGVGVVIARHPVHSALMLVQTLFGVAVLFVSQDAQFLAAVQVIVYAGAIVVLFLFVIMLLGVDRSENLRAEPLRAQRPLAVVLGAVTIAEILVLGFNAHWASGVKSAAGAASGGFNVDKLGRSIFTTYLFAFEATSVLLVIAVVGAVVLAKRTSGPTDTEQVTGPERTARQDLREEIRAENQARSERERAARP
jgi:NADH-quinone oxidoreductase subunit J